LFVLKPGGGRRCAVQLEEVATELAIRQGRFGERDVGGEARRLLLAGQGCQIGSLDDYEAGWLSGRIPASDLVKCPLRAVEVGLVQGLDVSGPLA
jgi:hypothetical protein